MGVLTLLAVIGFGLGSKGTENPQLIEETLRTPAILKVCMGCTYGSIQAAVDAAQPGDTIEVYLAPLTDLGWMENVIISKPVTIEAIRPYRYPQLHPNDVVLLPQNLQRDYFNPHFFIAAESGQVIIRGFTFRESAIKWIGMKSDLLLERNRFQESMLFLWGGPGRAEIRENEIHGSLSVFHGPYSGPPYKPYSGPAEVHLVGNYIDGTIKINQIDIDEDSRIEERKAHIILKTNIVNGSVGIDAGNVVLMEDNILIGRAVSEFGIVNVFEGLILSPIVDVSLGRWFPIVLEANRNIITNYLWGIVIKAGDTQTSPGDCHNLPLGLLQLSGQDNVFVQNRYEDLCPADYPWPPGFRK